MRKWYRNLRKTVPPTDAKLRKKFFEEKVGVTHPLSRCGLYVQMSHLGPLSVTGSKTLILTSIWGLCEVLGTIPE